MLTAFVLAFPAVAVADERTTITVTLDPSEGLQESDSGLQLNREAAGAVKAPTDKRYQAQVQNKTAAKDVTVGRVGVITAAKADIKAQPTSKAHTLFSCPKDTYLAIVSDNPAWYGVLMIDSSTGWVEKSKVGLLDYKVVGQPSTSNDAGSRIVQTALKYLGIPYKWGGYSFSGLDCSGFVKAVFASHGVSLPRVSRDQAKVGRAVSFSQLRAGDLLLFACKGNQIDHVGIYMGNGLFIHSSVSRGGVAVDSIMKPFYLNSLVAARRC